MLKIAFFDAKQYDIQSFNDFSDKYNDKIQYFETKLTFDTVSLAKGFDCVCIFVNDTVNKAVIDELKRFNVKCIALRCAGFNNVDIEYAKLNNICVFRVPAYSPYSVAEHTMALLLTINRRIHKAYIRTRDYNFSLNNLTGFDLHGKTVGVIGTGKIGKVFIDISLGFGMKVIAYDKFPSLQNIKYVNLDELFNQSDIISLHCPLTSETYHLIDGNNISKLKDGVIILNTSRGALIDSEALLSGIKSRKIGAACLDVYEEESDYFFEDRSSHILDDDILARLISMPNVIVTSHQAFLTKEALSNIAETTLKNITEFFETGKCVNQVT